MVTQAPEVASTSVGFLLWVAAWLVLGVVIDRWFLCREPMNGWLTRTFTDQRRRLESTAVTAALVRWPRSDDAYLRLNRGITALVLGAALSLVLVGVITLALR
jgi:hypothetical protein